MSIPGSLWPFTGRYAVMNTIGLPHGLSSCVAAKWHKWSLAMWVTWGVRCGWFHWHTQPYKMFGYVVRFWLCKWWEKNSDHLPNFWLKCISLRLQIVWFPQLQLVLSSMMMSGATSANPSIVSSVFVLFVSVVTDNPAILFWQLTCMHWHDEVQPSSYRLPLPNHQYTTADHTPCPHCLCCIASKVSMW